MLLSALLARRAGSRLQLSAAFSGLVLTLLAAKPALGCPDCALGREAWFWFLNDRFALHLLAACLPFLVVGGVAAILPAFERASADRHPETRR